MPKKHEVNEALGITAEIAAELDRAASEMEAEDDIDPTASGTVYPAELGTGGQARQVGPTTSPKIVRHDVPFVQLKNQHPYLESDEIEELMEHVYGKSVYEAAAEDFKSFDKAKLEEVLAMSEEEALDLLDEDES